MPCSPRSASRRASRRLRRPRHSPSPGQVRARREACRAGDRPYGQAMIGSLRCQLVGRCVRADATCALRLLTTQPAAGAAGGEKIRVRLSVAPFSPLSPAFCQPFCSSPRFQLSVAPFSPISPAFCQPFCSSPRFLCSYVLTPGWTASSLAPLFHLVLTSVSSARHTHSMHLSGFLRRQRQRERSLSV